MSVYFIIVILNMHQFLIGQTSKPKVRMLINTDDSVSINSKV